MEELAKCIENLQVQIERHRRKGLKEYPTRTILIDPLLKALGWDVRDPDVVELEYPTIDGKSVDYALKINRRPVLLVEAKKMADSLDDVKSVTQVVGYAANDGIEWCVLTNGVSYKVYRASVRAAAPEKLLFEVSIDSPAEPGADIRRISKELSVLSRKSLAAGVLDELGEHVFTTAKVQKALEKLCLDPTRSFVQIIRRTIDDDSITTMQIKRALERIMIGTPDGAAALRGSGRKHAAAGGSKPPRSRGREYDEAHHVTGKPGEVVELYRALNRFCMALAPGEITLTYRAMYISWSFASSIFCSVHLQRKGLRVWLKLDPRGIQAGTVFARDVSKVGHWGVGDVELAIGTLRTLREAEPLIRSSFEKARRAS